MNLADEMLGALNKAKAGEVVPQAEWERLLRKAMVAAVRHGGRVADLIRANNVSLEKERAAKRRGDELELEVRVLAGEFLSLAKACDAVFEALDSDTGLEDLDVCIEHLKEAMPPRVWRRDGQCGEIDEAGEAAVEAQASPHT